MAYSFMVYHVLDTESKHFDTPVNRFNIIGTGPSKLNLSLLVSTGTAETAIHFVIYEHFKKMMMARKQTQKLDLSDCMWIAAVAKLTASSICYPHGERVVLSVERYTCMLPEG